MKIDEKWMQMILRGGWIIEQAHIKLLRNLTSDKPICNYSLCGCQPTTLHTELCALFSRSLSQGDLDVFEKVFEANSGEGITQTPLSSQRLVTWRAAECSVRHLVLI